MLIKTRTDIGFAIPDEYQTMIQFEANHPDWVKSETSRMVMYTKEYTCYTDIAQEDK